MFVAFLVFLCDTSNDILYGLIS